MLVLNADELGQEPEKGMDLAVKLGITQLEVRTAWGSNAIMLEDARLHRLRELAEVRGLTVAAFASPLWKWCDPRATPGRVDSWKFACRVDPAVRITWVERALRVAQLLGTKRVRIFSALRVEVEWTENFGGDPLLPRALDMAERAGVRLLLENEPVCTVSRHGRLLEVLEQHSPRLGLWFDLANLHEVGDGSTEAVRELAPYTEYVHVKDYRTHAHGAIREFVAPGSGEVPYGRLLPVLAAARPGLPYALGTHVRDAPVTALNAGAAFLRGAGVVDGVR
ncbi:sugar phosphate isomerase/epimerase [Streptomyces sp. SM12]|uniref:sugar phosphate isomerase/epimerase family protein n=1 Tax=Streptomyces sp. SM12 TaxID=1071602 RepID=UPI000CD4FA80|nr:sugar phosphate isomerase/epimerase family protein [Streptomyces sp. SM12]